MAFRSYRGRMVYRTNGVGETGREFFSVTVHPDGTRTLRAQCEMDEDRLLRDVVLTVDARWRPRDAFVRLTIADEFVGSTWYRFGEDHAECQGYTAREGRFSQRFAMPQGTACLGTHALHGDAWTVGRLRQHDGPAAGFQFVTFAVSVLANGGSGPTLIPVRPDFAQVSDRGEETLEVIAGRFRARHVRIEVPGVDYFDVWAGGEDCLPVKLTSDTLGQNYELIAIEGDHR